MDRGLQSYFATSSLSFFVSLIWCGHESMLLDNVATEMAQLFANLLLSVAKKWFEVCKAILLQVRFHFCEFDLMLAWVRVIQSPPFNVNSGILNSKFLISSRYGGIICVLVQEFARIDARDSPVDRWHCRLRIRSHEQLVVHAIHDIVNYWLL